MLEERVKNILNFSNGNIFFQKLVQILKFEEDANGIVILLGTKENCQKLNQYIEENSNISVNQLWQKAISFSK